MKYFYDACLLRGDSLHIDLRVCFQYYNVWLSLAGFLSCVAIMLLISWIMSLVTFAIFFTLYLIVHYRDPGEYRFQFNKYCMRLRLTYYLPVSVNLSLCPVINKAIL